MKRLLKDEEIEQANNFIGWTFWFGPVLFSLAALVAGWLDRTREPTAHVLFFFVSIPALLLWFVRIIDYRRIRRDIDTRVVEDIQTAPDRVWAGKALWQLGFYYMRVQGKNIRVPSSQFKELQEANLVRIAFLPQSRLAVAVEVIHGIGL